MDALEHQRVRTQLYTQLGGDPRSDVLGLWIVLAVLGLTLTGISLSFWGTGLVWLLGQLLVALSVLQWFVLLHDFGHGGFFRTRALNSIVGHVASFFVILPFYPWKVIHAAHHTWTGWKDLDPTMSQIQPRRLPVALVRGIDFCWKAWIPVFGLSFSFGNFWNLKKIYRLFPESSVRLRCIWSCVYLVITVVPLVVLFPLEVLRVYGLAYFLYLFVSDPLLLSQHASIPQRNALGEKVNAIPHAEQDLYTRTLLFPEFVSKWILLRFDRHGPHHHFPSLPLYRLAIAGASVRNAVPALAWLRAAKATPAHRLLLDEGNLETGKKEFLLGP
jgi:omega-6 fatty acid desaturase (delta-12 desaturase)